MNPPTVRPHRRPWGHVRNAAGARQSIPQTGRARSEYGEPAHLWTVHR